MGSELCIRVFFFFYLGIVLVGRVPNFQSAVLIGYNVPPMRQKIQPTSLRVNVVFSHTYIRNDMENDHVYITTLDRKEEALKIKCRVSTVFERNSLGKYLNR